MSLIKYEIPTSDPLRSADLLKFIVKKSKHFQFSTFIEQG